MILLKKMVNNLFLSVSNNYLELIIKIKKSSSLSHFRCVFKNGKIMNT